MEISTLKKLRFFIPGLIILVCWYILGGITTDWSIRLPKTFEDAMVSIPVVVFSIAYYVLPLRGWANNKFYRLVNENLRSGLLQIVNIPDDPKRYSWPKVRGIFYGLLDNDPSLTKKSKLAYENGLFWTSIADVRAVTIVFSIFSVFYFYVMSSDGALIAAWLFYLTTIVTFPISRILTKRHQNIGNEQLEIIGHFHSTNLQKLLGAL